MSPQTITLITDILLKATLGLGLAALVAAALTRASAATRHLVWTLGVATALLLPALRGIAPRWDLPLLPATPTVARIESLAARTPLPHAAATRAKASLAPRPDSRTDAGAAASRAESLPAAKPIAPGAIVGLVWLAGFVLVGLPLLIGALRVSWHARRTAPFASASWSALVEEVAESIELSRPVRLLRGRARSMPMAAGLLHPAVLLPEDAESWPCEQRRAVLTHELGHVKRHDCLTQALAHAACAVYWFHPLAWIAAWRLRVERERACDDLVLRAGANGPDYADQLLQLARDARGSSGPAWALAMARPSQLEGRLLAILDPSRERQGLSRGMTAATAAAVALLAVVLAGLQPWAAPVSANTTLAFETLGADALATAPQQPTPQPSAPSAPSARQQRRAAEQPVVTPEPERHARGKAASPAVVAALSEAIHDSDAEVRQQAVNTLGELRV
ncbi:MAG TPA: M56 family metallopeptidase, partial [Vicinamibacteria bacterium]